MLQLLLFALKRKEIAALMPQIFKRVARVVLPQWPAKRVNRQLLVTLTITRKNIFRPLKETKAQVLPPMAILGYSRM
jgi:hypothetical protein